VPLELTVSRYTNYVDSAAGNSQSRSDGLEAGTSRCRTSYDAGGRFMRALKTARFTTDISVLSATDTDLLYGTALYH